MVKTIALIKKKAGISREEFIMYYEEVHAPLALKHLPMIKKYTRNHIFKNPAIEGPDFDCITELWLDSNADVKKLLNFVQSDAGKVIRDDEEKFLDRENTKFIMVDEKISII
ncbi:MAG: EthD domain-containing protein [Desulfobacterales bacterium]|jgi:uncharacterized protein (TIGR02118 family)|nr:EthD domain-containing protein [Desulfobacteraceae bacterium]MBT7085495.1 EthD domain-containing protein [Desulfobacterales bacterium]